MSDQLEMFAAERPQATPCAKCGTTGGALRNGVPRRFKAAKYGLVGEVCLVCRQKLRRAEASIAAGRVPGVRGRRREDLGAIANEGPPTDDVFQLRPAVVTPEDVAEGLRLLRLEHERIGRRPAWREDEAESIRQRNAEMAARERAKAVASRRLAMAAR